MCDVTPPTTVKDVIDVLYISYKENVPKNIIDDLYKVYPSHYRITPFEITTLTNEFYKRISEWYCRFLTIRLEDLPIAEFIHGKVNLPSPIISSNSKPEYLQRFYIDFNVVNGELHGDVLGDFEFVEKISILSGSSTEGVFEHNSSAVKYIISDGIMWGGENTSFLPFAKVGEYTRLDFKLGENVTRVRVFGGKFDRIIRLPERIIFDIGGVKFYTTDGAISRLGALDSRHHHSFNRNGILHFF